MVFGSSKRHRSTGASHPSASPWHELRSSSGTRLRSGEDEWDIAHAYRDDRGVGWVAFAGTLLLILGILNLIEGLAAIGDAHFFARNTTYITGSLHT